MSELCSLFWGQTYSPPLLSFSQTPLRWWWTSKSLKTHTTSVCTNTYGGISETSTWTGSPTLAMWRELLPTAWRSFYSERSILSLPIFLSPCPSPSHRCNAVTMHECYISKPKLYIVNVTNNALQSEVLVTNSLTDFSPSTDSSNCYSQCSSWPHDEWCNGSNLPTTTRNAPAIFWQIGYAW